MPIDKLPSPRTPGPAQCPALRWGILGTGWVAARFAASLRRHTPQQLAAVGSRQPARARSFATEHSVARAHGSYEDLVADPGVDVVYIATPHPLHLAHATLALEAGKHVLVEKPFTVNAAQAQQLGALAAQRGLFCMEALWTLFLPRYDVVRQVLADGVLGEVRTVQAEYGEHFGPEHRIMRLDLAGGPLLDLGTYPLSLAVWALGEPQAVAAMGQPHPAGVNGQVGALLRTSQGAQALVHTSLFSDTPSAATIAGDRAVLHLPGPFYQPGDIVVRSFDGGAPLVYTEERSAHDALHHQAGEVARCVSAGLLESPLRPVAASVAYLRVMDEIRRQCGIVFPGGT